MLQIPGRESRENQRRNQEEVPGTETKEDPANVQGRAEPNKEKENIRGRVAQFAKQKVILKEKDLISVNTQEHGYCRQTERFGETQKERVRDTRQLMQEITRSKANAKLKEKKAKNLKWIY